MQLRKQTVGYVTAALSLVAGLAWNDAVRSLIDIFFPLNTSGVFIKFSYAVFITIVVVILSTSLLRSAEKNNKESQ